jgi:hypothetical protein
MAVVSWNFKDLAVKDGTTVDKVMPKGTHQILAQPKGSQGFGIYELITREQAKGREIEGYDNYISNQTDIIKASVQSDYLKKDLGLFQAQFLSRFPDMEVGFELYTDEREDEIFCMRILNFPLPPAYRTRKGKTRYYNSKGEDIVVVIREYPDNGPFGIHIDSRSINRKRITRALRDKERAPDHLLKRAVEPPKHTKKITKMLSKHDWKWLCFHYEDDNLDPIWNFDLRDIGQGDCLTKYFINLYVALSGEFPDAE